MAKSNGDQPKLYKLRNIRIAYGLNFILGLQFTWAIWLLYYLEFFDYASVGIILGVMTAISILMEVPSGALADLVGKKYALMLAFALLSIGELLMSQISDFNGALIAIIFIAIGNSMISGTIEAFAYDSLKENSLDKYYDRFVSRKGALSSIAYAIATVVGGLMYMHNIRLPMQATSFTRFVGFILLFWAVEPKVDTLKFSMRNFIRQNAKGLKVLFSTDLRKLSVLLLLISTFNILIWMSFDDALMVSYGHSGKMLGILYSGAAVIAAVVSYQYEKIRRRIGALWIFVITAVITFATLLMSVWAGIILGSLLMLGRMTFWELQSNALSEVLNEKTPSKVRATTLSTFNLLTSIPLLGLAYIAGVGMDRIGIQHTLLITIIVFSPLIILALYNYMRPLRSRKVSTVEG